jgi:hypothetical protein
MVFAMWQEWHVGATKSTRGVGGDIVKLWFEEAQADDPKLWCAPMNLQNFWSNFPNEAKQFRVSPTKTQLISCSSSSMRVVPITSPVRLLVGQPCQVIPRGVLLKLPTTKAI